MKIVDAREISTFGISDFVEYEGREFYIGLPVNDLVQIMIDKGEDTVGVYTEADGYQRWDIATFETGSFAAIEGSRPATCPKIHIGDGIGKTTDESVFGKMLLRAIFIKEGTKSRVIVKDYEVGKGYKVYRFDIAEDEEFDMSPYQLRYSQELEDSLYYITSRKEWL
jgi:hypothetical protein